MTIRLHRFDYGNLRDFRAPIVASVLPDESVQEAPPPPPPPTFSEAELDAARNEARQAGYAEGFADGMGRAAEQAEAKRQSVDTTILQLGNVLNGLQRDYQHILQEEAAHLSQLVLMIARKVAGNLLDTHGAETVSAMVAECLPAVLSKPRLTIELNPDAFDETIDRIETLLHASGFEGELQFRTNPALGPYDTVLDWGNGQAARDTAAIWAGIESVLATMPMTLRLPQAELSTDMGIAAAPAPAPEQTPPTIQE